MNLPHNAQAAAIQLSTTHPVTDPATRPAAPPDPTAPRPGGTSHLLSVPAPPEHLHAFGPKMNMANTVIGQHRGGGLGGAAHTHAHSSPGGPPAAAAAARPSPAAPHHARSASHLPSGGGATPRRPGAGAAAAAAAAGFGPSDGDLDIFVVNPQSQVPIAVYLTAVKVRALA